MTVLTHFEEAVRPLFVETGTNIGNTLAHACLHFERCISIEENLPYYLGAIERFKFKHNVWLYHGPSTVILTKILDPSVATTFWLDAHYSGNGDTLGIGGQCPLLQELAIIVGLKWDVPPVIMIDDAFMFDDSVNHPGFPYPFWSSNYSDHTVYNRQHWPRVEQIDEVLAGYKRSILQDEVAFRYDWVNP